MSKIYKIVSEVKMMLIDIIFIKCILFNLSTNKM